MLDTILTIIQLVTAILLVVVVMMQQKGDGLGAVFGGTNGVYTTKRGGDLILHRATAVISLVFFGVALLNVIL